jgi:ARG/rhodanese/phosphatase superfamily protein
MKRIRAVLALPLLLASSLAVAQGLSNTPAQFLGTAAESRAAAAEPAAADFDLRDFEAGEPILAYNLAVVPLHTRKAPPYDDYTVLEEAQAGGKVVVREVGEGDVPELSVRNKDERPLYLLGGEVVLGGKQDRMVQSDEVLDAGERRRIPVVCVEQGRWDGESLTFQPGLAVAHPDLRRAALFSEQGAVWGEVARKSQVSGVSSPTGTYRRVLQDAKIRQRIAQYLDELQAKLPRDDRMAGLAVAINGELEVVDVFDSPRLYGKLERKLLASYVLAALEKQPARGERAEQTQAKARALKQKDIDDFVTGAGSQEGTSTGEVQTKVFRAKGKALHGTFFGAEKR